MDQITVSRTFDAPLETLWKAWIEPEQFMKWYGPKGFTAPTCEIDLREGGHHLWSMQSPDGRQMYFTGSYMQNPEHIVHGFRSMPSTDSGACRPLIPEQ
ncbi:MAG: SRPBCC domain-containing protein, partial [Anaerolineales bacterium]|nr:SRPBCC domain-containing protein [Candidatus Desulfolinea nitratireducens]